MGVQVAIANIADGRSDFYEKRRPLVEEELKSLDWIRKDFACVESEIIRSDQDIQGFVQKVRSCGPQTLIIHIPIWAEPILSIKLYNHIKLPVLLLGNNRPETSSMVGLLGSGGALDQMGCDHLRVFDHEDHLSKMHVSAFIRASAAINELRGQTLGRFGGRSLGIATADIDPSQWQQLFGVNVENIDQYEIVDIAEKLDGGEVEAFARWFRSGLGGVEYGGAFNAKALDKQIRGYLATVKLIEKYRLDLIAVKCQPELSDGYVAHCLAHMMLNGSKAEKGRKQTLVHACESDADGALTMQILRLLTGGNAAALLDIRWFNRENGVWTLANCGAMPLDFYAEPEADDPLAKVKMVPHVFGTGGGGALSGVVKPQKVTMARLCRKNGAYRMAILSGEVVEATEEEMAQTTGAFPKAFVKTAAGIDFLDFFGSNHIHMVSGSCTEQLVMFCKLKGIQYKVW